MNQTSQADLSFRLAFEAGEIKPEAFDHTAHLRLAYIYLCEAGQSGAQARMRAALKRFLKANGVPAAKYHETLTLAWLKAVQYFMARAGRTSCFEAFLARDNCLLDTAIMLTHYRKETLFSDTARLVFVPPDIEPIPDANNDALG